MGGAATASSAPAGAAAQGVHPPPPLRAKAAAAAKQKKTVAKFSAQAKRKARAAKARRAKNGAVSSPKRSTTGMSPAESAAQCAVEANSGGRWQTRWLCDECRTDYQSYGAAEQCEQQCSTKRMLREEAELRAIVEARRAEVAAAELAEATAQAVRAEAMIKAATEEAALQTGVFGLFNSWFG